MMIRFKPAASAAAMILAAASLTATAEDAATKPADAAPMGHSVAGKEHTMMDRASPSIAPAGAPAPDNGMGHSPAGKEHQMMNHQHPKGGKSKKSGDGGMNMMGHSPASKEHTQMNTTPADDGKPTP